MRSQPPSRPQVRCGVTQPGPHAPLASRLGRLTVLKRRFSTCETVPELLAAASSLGPGVCGFERGLVLSVIDGHLTSNGMHALDDPGSDALRHRCQLKPIPLAPDSEEAEVIRVAQGEPAERWGARSVVAHSLGLEKYTLAAVVPESQALALVVFDRPSPAVNDDDHAAVQAFAYLLGLAVFRVVLPLRIRKTAQEVRHLTASANALLKEAQLAPIDANELLRVGGPTLGVRQ